MSDYTLSVPVNENDHFQGNRNAPLVLVEYGDYQCPYCGMAYPIVKQLQEDFGDQLGFVFRNFPLTQMHEYSLHAAEAAELAADADKFWEMHDSLYEDQKALTDNDLVNRAKKLGMDGHRFEADLEAGTKADKVQADFMSGVDSGVNGTPGFFINGEKYNDSWDYAVFKQALQERLNA